MQDMGSITQNKAISSNVFLILGISRLMENPKNSNHKSQITNKSQHAAQAPALRVTNPPPADQT